MLSYSISFLKYHTLIASQSTVYNHNYLLMCDYISTWLYSDQRKIIKDEQNYWKNLATLNIIACDNANNANWITWFIYTFLFSERSSELPACLFALDEGLESNWINEENMDKAV